MKLSNLIVVMLLLASCSRQRTADYFIVQNKSGVLDSLLINSVKIDTFSNGAQTITYYTDKDTIGFHLRKDTMTLSETTWGVKEIDSQKFPVKDNEIINPTLPFHADRFASELKLINITSVTVAKEQMDVFIYKQDISNENSYYYYWTPGLGIIFRHANSTQEVALLQSFDPIRQKKILQVIMALNLTDKINSERINTIST